ncbi:MAG: metallophosphoesterase family protein [Rubrobacter sp.]|nr:metallophosphoesterase family protein [Rubrobacter sp.]
MPDSSPAIVVIADTHIPRRAKALPETLLPHLGRADLVIHAGDLMDASLLDELESHAPTLAVRGNLDPPDERLPEVREFEFGGVRIAVIHDSGPKRGRRNRMKLRFPEARVVVFGHSHIPLLEDDGELLLLNPGSPTDKRREPEYTFAVLRVKGGEASAEIASL